MFILTINAATICIAHNFLTSKDSNLNFVFVEKSDMKKIRMTALDYHKMISFCVEGANDSGNDFHPFGFHVDREILKIIKPNKDSLSNVSLHINDTNNFLKAKGVEYPISVTDNALDVTKIWQRAKTDLLKDKTFIPSVIPLKQLKYFDFSNFFSTSISLSIIKARGMLLLNFQGLPEGIEARGILMQMTAGTNQAEYLKEFKEFIPNWC